MSLELVSSWSILNRIYSQDSGDSGGKIRLMIRLWNSHQWSIQHCWFFVPQQVFQLLRDCLWIVAISLQILVGWLIHSPSLSCQVDEWSMEQWQGSKSRADHCLYMVGLRFNADRAGKDLGLKLWKFAVNQHRQTQFDSHLMWLSIKAIPCFLNFLYSTNFRASSYLSQSTNISRTITQYSLPPP